MHKLLGTGFQEVVYQRALEIELNLRGIKYNREFEMPVFYKGQLIGTRGVGFLVEELITVELKVVKILEEVDLDQAASHLEAHCLEIGLLINFGTISLDYRRIVNTKVNQTEIEKQE